VCRWQELRLDVLRRQLRSELRRRIDLQWHVLGRRLQAVVRRGRDVQRHVQRWQVRPSVLRGDLREDVLGQRLHLIGEARSE